MRLRIMLLLLVSSLMLVGGSTSLHAASQEVIGSTGDLATIELAIELTAELAQEITSAEAPHTLLPAEPTVGIIQDTPQAVIAPAIPTAEPAVEVAQEGISATAPPAALSTTEPAVGIMQDTSQAILSPAHLEAEPTAEVAQAEMQLNTTEPLATSLTLTPSLITSVEKKPKKQYAPPPKPQHHHQHQHRPKQPAAKKKKKPVAVAVSTPTSVEPVAEPATEQAITQAITTIDLALAEPAVGIVQEISHTVAPSGEPVAEPTAEVAQTITQTDTPSTEPSVGIVQDHPQAIISLADPVAEPAITQTATPIALAYVESATPATEAPQAVAHSINQIAEPTAEGAQAITQSTTPITLITAEPAVEIIQNTPQVVALSAEPIAEVIQAPQEAPIVTTPTVAYTEPIAPSLTLTTSLITSAVKPVKPPKKPVSNQKQKPIATIVQKPTIPNATPPDLTSDQRAQLQALFFEAVRNGNTECIRNMLVTKLANLTDTDSQGNTIVHIAAENNQDRVLELLQKEVRGLSFATRNKKGDLPFHIAVRQGSPSTLRFFTQIPETDETVLQSTDRNGEIPLLYCIKIGRLQAAEQLMRHTKNQLTVTDKKGLTAVHLAAITGNFNFFKRLLTFNNNPILKASEKLSLQEKENTTGNTPLLTVTLNGHLDTAAKMAQLLIKNGANLYETNNNGNTPLHIAARNGHAKLTELYLNHFLNTKNPSLGINKKNTTNGNSALHLAAREGKLENVVLLVETGKASINARNNNGRTPLFLAERNQKAAPSKERAAVIAYLKKMGGKKH